MKSKFFVLFLLIFISTFPIQFMVNGQTNEDPKPPAPTFITIESSVNIENNLVPENQTITIKYEADRFDVDGLILVGFGSNLTEDPSSEFARNFTKVSSLKAISSYEVELNVTSYTYFYAYSWYNTIENRTREEFDTIDNILGHQLWIDKGPKYPELAEVKGGTIVDSNKPAREANEFYAPLGANLTFVYRVTQPEDTNATFATLVLANSTDMLYNISKSLRVNMSLSGNWTDGYYQYEYNYTMTQRIVFFTAFNEYGWERIAVDKPITHKVTTGFDMKVSFTEKLNEYTDLDPIVFNMTSTNETTDDVFFYRYRYFANASVETPTINWTETRINDGFRIEQKEENITRDDQNFTQSISIYNIELDTKFNVSQKVELQVFVTYNNQSYNESTPYTIIIQDSRPTVTLVGTNNTLTNKESAVINWEYSTLRGDIISAVISSNQTGISASILNADNFTVSFINDSKIIEGYHGIFINVTNKFSVVNTTTNINQSRYDVETFSIIQIIYQVDVTAPEANFINPPQVSDSKGLVEIEFNFADKGIFPSGVIYAKLSWGNNLSIEVTDLTFARIVYRKSGNYTISLTVFDKIGNNQSISIEVKVTLPETNISTKKDTPLLVLPVLFSIAFIVLVTRAKKHTIKK